MKLFKGILLLVAIFGLLLSSCAPKNNQPSVDEMQTLVARTVDALQTEIALQPTSTPVPTALLPTFTSIPTLLPTATRILPTATNTPVFSVARVEDLTIPAGTTLKGGQTFVKTWKITNGGTQTWGKDFKIVFVSGDSMGITSITLGKLVYPGTTYEVSVKFTAPVKAGSHTANFMLETNDGYQFGIGSADRPWLIRINVENIFQVTAASLVASVNPYVGPCPASITLTPYITVNGSGTVTYYIRIGSGITDTYSLTFTDSGILTGNIITWPIDASMTSLQANIYVDVPNHQDFGVLTVPITCTP